MRSFFCILVFISTVSFYVNAQPAIRLVPSDPIVVDGKIGEAEWKDASRFELSGGGTVFLKSDGEHLLVGVRGVKAGWSHLYLNQGNEAPIELLHASAALGSTRYAPDQNKLWQPSGTFAWDLRDQAITPETNQKMSEHLARNLWVANNNNMGNPTEIEFKVKLREPRSNGLHLAVVYAADAKVPQYFPASLKDDTLKEDLIYGNTPGDLRFDPRQWMKIDLESVNKTPAVVQTSIPDRGFIPVDDNARIFYERVGKGKQAVVVPLHMLMYEDFKHLAKGRTFIFYDVRNRGRSSSISDGSKLTIQHDVEDLEKLRQHFGIDKMTLIGESYVGLMVVMYAMKYPRHVERLIQIGPVPLKYGTKYPVELTANDQPPVPDPAEVKKIDELYEKGLHRTDPQEFCRRDWEVVKFGLVGDPKNVDKLRSLCHLPNEWPVNLYRHFASHFVSVQKLDISKEDAAKVTVPVLTIHGTKDRNAAYGSGRDWSGLLPNARLLTVNGAAHFPWLDEPKLVFDSIKRFLGGKFPERSERIAN